MDRYQLIQLSTEGKIKYKKKFLQEADEETIGRICAEYAAQQLDKANGQLADIMVTKFSEFMEKVELIRSKYNLEKDLSKDELVKIVGVVTPYIPFIGLISGDITVGTHVVEKKMSDYCDENTKKNEGNTFEEMSE